MSTMKELFKGYSNYSDEEYKIIWKNAIIVVDANILLNFYRYSEDTRKEIFKILENQKKRLWIPYQVGKEYFDNKNNVMVSHYNEYDRLLNNIKNKILDANKELDNKKNNQLKCKSKLEKILTDSINNITNTINQEKTSKKPKFERNSIEEKILNLFNDKIGEQFDKEEYVRVKNEGMRRIQENIPPGYKDNGKEENGDYYIFYSMIQKAKKDNIDVIFVTDDVKEDWFCKYNGEIHGGRCELLNEFYKETGKLLLIYSSDGFVQAYAQNIDNNDINEKIIDELKTIRYKDNLYGYQNYYNLEIQEDFLYILKDCKEDLLHNLENADLNEMCDKIEYIIMSLRMQNANRRRYINKLYDIKETLNNSDNYLASQKLINLIENLLISSQMPFSTKKVDKLYSEIAIKEQLFILLMELKKSKTQEEQNIIYTNILDISKNYLKNPSFFSNKHFMVLLENIVYVLSKELNHKTLRGKREIINYLEELLNVMELK